MYVELAMGTHIQFVRARMYLHLWLAGSTSELNRQRKPASAGPGWTDG